MAAPATPNETLYKVLVIGEGNTGKTCLIRRYIHSVFTAQHKATVGVDFALKVLQRGGTTVTMQLWDIAGQEETGSMTRVYFQSALGAAVVCDMTRPASFEAAIRWKNDLDSKVFIGTGDNQQNVPCVLMVNKCDMDTPCHLSDEELEEFCKKNNFKAFYKTSAKTDVNVGTSFEKLVDEITKAKETVAGPAKPEAPKATVSKKAQKKEGCKC